MPDARKYQANGLTITRVANGWMVTVQLWDQGTYLVAGTEAELLAILGAVDWIDTDAAQAYALQRNQMRGALNQAADERGPAPAVGYQIKTGMGR